MNLKPDEILLECTPSFAELPDGEYGKGLVFSGNVKYLPLQQFISQHDPRHLRVVVRDNCVVGLVQKADPWALAQAAKAAELAEAKPVKADVAESDEAAQNGPKMKKGPFGRLVPA